MVNLQQRGFCVYHKFDKVVKLTVNQRAQVSSIDQEHFRNLLVNARDGSTTVDEWNKRLARAPDKIPNLDQSEQQAIKLSFANEKVAKDNSLHLNKLGNPIAQINAKHNNAKASKLTADDMGGSPELFLCKGARVMLTRNIWTETGL